jgi:wyosine [tRNA(Phe)-imidazoG37] synthetase (radical SAM superfamily)
MVNKMQSFVFGPIPSRRLGQSLGINNIPPKVCSYSCVYCQIGRTDLLRIDRASLYSSDDVCQAVSDKIKAVHARGEKIDYLTFVPDGEPTLDINLGHTIDILRIFGIKIVVISNASLIWMRNVREDLSKADLVSLKIDAVDNETWKRINRPHSRLRLDDILEGISKFSDQFTGTFITETMIAAGMNDSVENANGVSEFIKGLRHKTAYILVPIRPPAESDVKTPSEKTLMKIYDSFQKNLPNVELLIGHEGYKFAYSGNAEEDILGITSVHPMREDAVQKFLKKSGEKWTLIQNLIDNKKLIKIPYQGKNYYLRKLRERQ